MQYLTTFSGGQIRKGYEKGIAAIEFIGRCMKTLLKNVDALMVTLQWRVLGYRICRRKLESSKIWRTNSYMIT
jgi:hypothetical protein